jgi:hypothetical protein
MIQLSNIGPPGAPASRTISRDRQPKAARTPIVLRVEVVNHLVGLGARQQSPQQPRWDPG